jgi:hypothetical protein
MHVTIATKIRLLQQIPGRVSPFKRLAAAVISQAVRDATHQVGSGKESATTWLLHDGDGFPFWCSVLGIDPGQTRRELFNLLIPSTECRHGAFQSSLQPQDDDIDLQIAADW